MDKKVLTMASVGVGGKFVNTECLQNGLA